MLKYQPPKITGPRFAGIKTFMRLPNVKDIEGVDVAIVGAAFDTGASYKSGARFGPSAIREASTLMRNYSMNLEVNIFDYLSCIDYGDIDIIPGYIHETYQRIEEGLRPLIDAGVVPITLGGDHSITLGELRAVAKKHGPVALVHFDSHLDTWDNYWGMKYTHGTPFRRACEEGLIDTTHSIQVGIRGSQYGPEDIQGSKDLGFEVITANDLHEIGIKEGINRICSRVKNAKVFLSFDIDFIDPSMAPGTGTIEVGGFSGREGMLLIQGLKDMNIIAMDMVEVLPAIDPAGVTAYMAANLIHETISVLAIQKRDGKR
ncbi:MAG: agmatinase [Anaerovoracaceae bacterium]|jgi:agmatinase